MTRQTDFSEDTGMMKRDISELIKISRALKYEVEMLIETSRILYNYDLDQGDLNRHKIIINSVVESFTVHARILLYFLYSGQHKGDVVALDFFDDIETWRRNRPKRSKELRDIQYRVGKEIAHLTYERLEVKPSEKAWSLNIANELFKRVLLFRNLVQEEWVNPEFIQYVDSIADTEILAGV